MPYHGPTPKEEPVWDHLGLGVLTQGILVRAPRDTVMNPPGSPPATRLMEN